MKEMIEKFEGKLENAKHELNLLSTNLDMNSKEIGLESKNKIFFHKKIKITKY